LQITKLKTGGAMLLDKKISIIGTGNMGEALLKGLLQSQSARAVNLTCTDAYPQRLETLKTRYGILTTTDNIEAVRCADIVVYAVKPQVITTVLKQTAAALDPSKLIISVAAGVPLAILASCLQKDLRLIRAMPNMAAAVLASATAIAAGRNVGEPDLALARAVFAAVGETIVVDESSHMDAITGLSGSGPAYVFLMVEALADAGVKMGLTRADAQFMATQTLLGSAQLLKETREHPASLKDKVASPGGTSIAGIHALESGGLRAALIDAVEAATIRSKELGRLFSERFGEHQS